MVAHFTMRIYGVNQVFRFVEGIWLLRNSRQIQFFFGMNEREMKYKNHAIIYVHG